MYRKRTSTKTTRILYFIAMFFAVVSTFGSSPSYLTYSAKIVKPDGNPLETTRVDFRFVVQNAAGTCSIYSETFSNVNMAGTQGLAVITLGSGIREFPSSGSLKFTDVFDNTQTYNCSGTGTYAGTAGASRQIVMQFNDGSGWQTVPAMQVTSVPYASYAYKAQQADTATTATNAASATTAATAVNALTLNGYADTAFVMKSGLPTCTAGQVLFYNGTAFSCVAGSTGGTSGTVTSVSSANSYISVTSASSTPIITLNVGTTANTVAAGNDSRITGALQASGNLSDLTSSATARNNLGLGSSGVTAGTYGSVNAVPSFTVDALGRITSATSNAYQYADTINYGILRAPSGSNLTISSGNISLTASNVVSALGYTPAASGAGGSSSQWTTSGTSVYYATGNVGVGTSNTSNARFNVLANTAVNQSGIYSEGYVGGEFSGVHDGIVVYGSNGVNVGGADNGIYMGPSVGNALLFDRIYGTTLYSNSVGVTNTPIMELNHETSNFTSDGLYMNFANGSGSFTGNFLNLKNNSISKFIVTNSGRVGVGVSSPTYALDVSGTIRSTAGFRFPDGSVQTTAASGTGSSQWGTNGSSIYYSSGNVGLGTSSPQQALHVMETLRVERSTHNYMDVNFGSILGGDATDVQFTVGTALSTGYAFRTSNGGANITALGITGNGNVGVGTTSPSYNLDVSGTLRAAVSSNSSIPLTIKGAAGQSVSFMSVTDSAGSSIFDIANDKNIYLPAAGNIIISGAATSLNASGLTVNSSGGVFYTSTSNYYDTPNVALMRKSSGLLEINNGTLGQYRDLQVRAINPTTGNLGIGTSSPAYALDVSGTIRTTTGIRFPDGTTQTTAATGGGSVSGSGTTGKIPKWSSTSALTDSIMSESGSSLSVSGSINIPTTTSTLGIINMNNSPWIHSYGGSGNFFAGGAGNLTSSTGAGDKIGFGRNALANNDTSYATVGIGRNALFGNTSGSYNTAIGDSALIYSYGAASDNTAVGAGALANATGSYNTGMGVSSGEYLTTGVRNTFLGHSAGANLTTGSYNIMIGNAVSAPSITADYQLNIGNTIYGDLASGTIGIGISSGTAGLTVSAPVGAVGLQIYGDPASNSFLIESPVWGEMFSIGPYGDVNVRYDRALHVMSTTLDNSGLLVNNTGAVMFTNGSASWDMVDIMLSRSIGGTLAVSGTMDVSGDVNATGVVRSNSVVLTSDRRYKKNIEPLQSSLDKLSRLRGVEYDWRTSEFPEKRFTSSHQIGLIAQEVEDVYPEAVVTDVHGYKGVNYAILVSPLIESVKEINNKCIMSEKQIQTLAEKVNQHTRDIASLKEELKSKDTRIQKLEKQNELLMQRLDKIENLIRSK